MTMVAAAAEISGSCVCRAQISSAIISQKSLDTPAAVDHLRSAFEVRYTPAAHDSCLSEGEGELATLACESSYERNHELEEQLQESVDASEDKHVFHSSSSSEENGSSSYCLGNARCSIVY
jgi:hypothetical protein